MLMLAMPSNNSARFYQLAKAVVQEVWAKLLSYVGDRMPLTAGHENQVEQQSKQDSENYLIQ